MRPGDANLRPFRASPCKTAPSPGNDGGARPMPSLALTLSWWEFKGATFVDGHSGTATAGERHRPSDTAVPPAGPRPAPALRRVPEEHQERSASAGTQTVTFSLRLRGTGRSCAGRGGYGSGCGPRSTSQGGKAWPREASQKVPLAENSKGAGGSSQWEAFIFTSDSSVLFEFLYQTYRVFHRDTWQG